MGSREVLEYLRSNVLVLLAHDEGHVLEGNRRLETKLSKRMQDILAGTIPHEHSSEEYALILKAIMRAYIDLFDNLPPSLHTNVIKVNRAYFKQAFENT